MSSAICFNLDQSKFLSSGNGLKFENSDKKDRRKIFVPTTLYETMFNPLLDNKILEWSKLNQITDNILKCI